MADELRGETLLEQLADEVGVPPDDEVAAPASDGPFVAPVLERYEDMQDFLLVDPIHEVDDSGWPNKKTA